MGRSHHDQVRPVLREARLAIQRLLRRPGWLPAQIVRSSPVTDKRSATLLTRNGLSCAGSYFMLQKGIWIT